MLIRNATLLHGRDLDLLPSADVRISGRLIEKIGKGIAPRRGERVIDCEGLLMMPGLVNSHTHIGDSIGKDVGIDSGVEEKIHPVSGFKQRILKTSHPSHLKQFIRNSCVSMVKRGITTFIDFREGGLAGVDLLKSAAAGIPIRPVIMGRINYYQDMELVRKNSPLPRERRAELGALVAHCSGIGISGPNEFSDSVLGYFARQKTLRAIHSAETIEGNNASKRMTKRSETKRALLSRPDLLVHMTHASMEDLLLASRKGATIAVCPRANGALAEGIPNVELMMRSGCNVTIGTDNVMVNSPDMFREMDYIWKATMGMNRERLPPKSILKMATVNASQVLGGKIGVIQKNCFADCIFVEKHSIDLEPMHNPHAAIVHRVSENAIRAVMFEGEFAHGKI